MAKKKTGKKSPPRAAKRSVKGTAAKPAAAKAKKKGPTKTSAAKTKKKPLPRPTITGEEKLFLLFKEDYHARQIFDFLRVETVHELEQFAPDEIFKRLTRPMSESVERIRRRLAEKNRFLSGDQEYLLRTIQEARQARG